MLAKTLKKIMYVEDDPAIQQIVSFCLEDMGGYELKICSIGREALQEAGNFKPDLILMDMRLPGLSGPDTIKKLREMEEFKDLPVIFISAQDDGNELAKYSDLGALGVIKKPFDPITLCQTIEALYNTNFIQTESI